MTTISLPDRALVVLVGASGSGKSTFAARHFRATEVLSSDVFRGMVGDDENDLSLSEAAFVALHAVAQQRLHLGRLTVVDATNVHPDGRRPLVELALAHGAIPVAVVLDVPEVICLERNRGREDRDVPPSVLRRQRSALVRSLPGLEREGFDRVVVLRGAREVASAVVVRETSARS